ncbi:hypothetical protein BP00DRAFT_112213 [Aspergillus indologenus CBS 114.80]|uniref:Uncharacterized protein n=1 Tax=Aspergillus indologenus CBS 114.80 TaxID=1450541 RepID=A0A2V5IA37_9EURO|nr:hypothetical protein BP00DRAFT_112213 [Aspergillus indologenus CBS 114.80]
MTMHCCKPSPRCSHTLPCITVLCLKCMSRMLHPSEPDCQSGRVIDRLIHRIGTSESSPDIAGYRGGTWDSCGTKTNPEDMICSQANRSAGVRDLSVGSFGKYKGIDCSVSSMSPESDGEDEVGGSAAESKKAQRHDYRNCVTDNLHGVDR